MTDYNAFDQFLNEELDLDELQDAPEDAVAPEDAHDFSEPVKVNNRWSKDNPDGKLVHHSDMGDYEEANNIEDEPIEPWDADEIQEVAQHIIEEFESPHETNIWQDYMNDLQGQLLSCITQELGALYTEGNTDAVIPSDMMRIFRSDIEESDFGMLVMYTSALTLALHNVLNMPADDAGYGDNTIGDIDTPIGGVGSIVVPFDDFGEGTFDELAQQYSTPNKYSCKNIHPHLDAAIALLLPIEMRDIRDADYYRAEVVSKAVVTRIFTQFPKVFRPGVQTSKILEFATYLSRVTFEFCAYVTERVEEQEEGDDSL